MRSVAAMVLLRCADAFAFAPPASLRHSVALTSASFSPLRAQVPRAARGFQLQMQEDKKEGGFEISPWLRFDTRGGALVWTAIGIVLPFIIYGPVTDAIGGDEALAGRLIAGVYMVGVCLLWTFSYVFRVGTKDMTYSKQLKQYEDAVIAKRFEELQEDEVDALMTSLEEPSSNIKTKFTPEEGDKKIKGSGWRPDQY